MAGRTTELGYGHEHQLLRLEWEPIVAQGKTICTRHGHPQFPECTGRILPGQPWDLGHDDTDKTTYTGPEHRACNRRAGLLKAIGKLMPKRPTPREW